MSAVLKGLMQKSYMGILYLAEYILSINDTTEVRIYETYEMLRYRS